MDLDPGAYCRHIEDYLTRRDGGHRVRIVGPAFDLVRAWATKGIPVKVVQRGIDRYLERYFAKSVRRRPPRIEFCEADVLDVFDEWRRAVGVSTASTDHAADAVDSSTGIGAGLQTGPRARASLPAHLERVVARLTTLRAGEDRSLDDTIDALVREIDAARAGAKALRGEARERLLARLRALDATLLAATRERCDAETMAALGAEAEAELAPFRERMPREAYEQSRGACIDRLLRDRARLPVIAFE